MKKILFILVLFPALLFGQSQNRPSIKWQQVETQNFTVIFPQGIEDFAKETALILDSVYYYDTKSFNNIKPQHINILLYNRSVVSNAYAALAPRRMVWYTTPPQSMSLSLSPWNKTLAIHEFRHVTQYSKTKSGFTLLGSFFMGQYGHSGLLNWSVPNWYMEGDAVFNETKYSNSGRGRMPAFSLPIRTIMLNDQKISYEKAMFRSYKTYYPNHYYLGYYMVTYVNRYYGEEIWNKILSRTSLFSFWPYSFERSMKKYTGFNARETYELAMADADSLWKRQADEITISNSEPINISKKRSWTNYFDPQFVSNDTLLVLKSGYDDRTTLMYLLTNGEEKKIREISGEDISYAKGYVTWLEYWEHPRYGEESYSDIVVYNLQTKKTKYITKKSKYLSAELSRDASKIVAIYFAENLIPEITVFDLEGNVLFSKKITDANNVSQATWTSDGNNIVFLKTTSEGESMEMLNISTNEITNLIPAQWIKFERPKCNGNYVYFNYDYSGITNIYALELKTKEIFQVTSKPLASIQAVADNNNEFLYFTDYKLNGLDIERMPIITDNWIPLNEVKQNPVNYFEGPKTENTISNFKTDYVYKGIDTLKVTKYKPFKHSLKVHSWSPVINGINYGYKLYSTDVMNTLSISTSLYGNSTTKALIGSAIVSYEKFFPVFSLGFASGRQGEYIDEYVNIKNPIDSIETWHEDIVNFTISVPLNLSKGNYYRYFNAQIGTSYVGRRDFQGAYFNELGFTYDKIMSNSAQLYLVNRRYMGYRDLLPKFGQSLLIGYNNVPGFIGTSRYQFYTSANLYFPGIFRHNGLKINLAYEQKDIYDATTFNYAGNISVSRGYKQPTYDKIYKFSAEYQIPLLYPDINIPYLLYIKRLRLNIFFDYTKIYKSPYIGKLPTTGAELMVDFNILRINFATINAGVRYSYGILEKKGIWEFISFTYNM